MSAAPPDSNLQPMVRLLARAKYVFGALLVVTIGLFTWHHFGMERSLELTGDRFPVRVSDDHSEGGASEGRLERRGRDLVMHCNIIKQFGWPFCRMEFDLQAGADGVDMSGFKDMEIDIRSDGPESDRLRVNLINSEPGMTRPDDWQSYKVNEVTGLIPRHGPMYLPMQWFAVAPWWKDQAKPSLEHSYTRFDNVVRVELMTPGAVVPGKQVYVVRSVRLRGKLISQSELLMGLVALWIIAAITWPILAALSLRNELKRSMAELSLLTEVNRALELETRELAGQVHIDALTGALNRQGLRATLMNTSTLLAAPMSVIFMDIDHFKKINDSRGHDVGDAVLRQFAQVIASGLRSTDKLVRWGGEEFLIICPMTNVQRATILAEKLRTLLSGQAWPTGLKLTASFGVAQHEAADEIGVAIKRADHELYVAKANGRDRVQAYVPGNRTESPH